MLSDEVEDKSVLVCALESTGQNIQTEMELKGVGSQPIVAQVADVRSRWEELRKNIETHSKDVGISAEKFHRFITRLTGFVNWLDEFHGRLYDEVCIRLPAKASDELVSRHKNQLEVFRAEVTTHVSLLEEIKAESEEWEEHLVPEDVMVDLPSPSEASPPPDGKGLIPACKGLIIPAKASLPDGQL